MLIHRRPPGVANLKEPSQGRVSPKIAKPIPDRSAPWALGATHEAVHSAPSEAPVAKPPAREGVEYNPKFQNSRPQLIGAIQGPFVLILGLSPKLDQRERLRVLWALVPSVSSEWPPKMQNSQKTCVGHSNVRKCDFHSVQKMCTCTIFGTIMMPGPFRCG